MHTFPLCDYIQYIEMGDWEGVAGLMLSSVAKLQKAGADFAICPDNTIHQAFDLVIEKSVLPWLNIAEEVASEAARCQYRRIGLFGTRYLMEGPVYPAELAAFDLGYHIPDSDERGRINEIIFDELVNGLFTDESRIYFAKVINKFKKKGCDAVVLGCTEIPLLITSEDSSLPTLNSTRILARAALREATGSK